MSIIYHKKGRLVSLPLLNTKPYVYHFTMTDQIAPIKAIQEPTMSADIESVNTPFATKQPPMKVKP